MIRASGMALQSREPCAAGTVLEIKMLLLPSYSGIRTLGKVVECDRAGHGEPADEYPFRLRIDFSFMRDLDRDAELPAGLLLIGARPPAVELTFDQLRSTVASMVAEIRP